mgnify:CR=1 FL=1
MGITERKTMTETRPTPRGTSASRHAGSRGACERIEAAALALFAERPAEQVRLNEIAAAAGASLATIYRHYDDKQALLEVCLLRWADTLANRMLEHLQAVHTYRERLHKTFWVVLDFFETYPEVAAMLLSSVYPQAMRRHTTDTQKHLTRLLTGVLADGQAAGLLNQRVSESVLLDYFYGVLARLVQMQPLRHGEPRLTDQHEELFDMLWRALAEPDRGV